MIAHEKRKKKSKIIKTAHGCSTFLNNSVGGNSSDSRVGSDLFGQSCQAVKKFCSDLR